MLGRRSSFLRALSSRLTFPHMSNKWSHRLRLVLPHLVLLVATLTYALAGAFVFISIERPYEIENRNTHLRNIRDLQRSLLHLEAGKFDNTTLESIIDDLIFTSFVAFDAGIRLSDFDENVTLKWNLPSAIFFTTTVLTSIGYGHLVPISPLGRLFCIGYAFLGIPLTLITIADVAKFFSDVATSAYRNPLNTEVSGRTRLCIIAVLLFYMTVGALIFSVFETAWSFLDSFYFCLITVVTVGFGDLVPVGGEHYLAASILFIFIGLVLTTLAIDVIGSSSIDRIHAWGRGLDALNLLNALRNHKNQCWFAYVPKDAHLIPFIDCTDTSNKD